MGGRRRRSRAGDTADVAVARLRRGAHDVLDTVAGAAGELGDQVGAQVTAARRDLADRIDPAPVPRRGLRVLVLGLFVTTVSAVAWGVLARRPQTASPHGGPEHLPSTVSADAPAAGDSPPTGPRPSGDEQPVTGLTGEPESGSR